MNARASNLITVTASALAIVAALMIASGWVIATFRLVALDVTPTAFYDSASTTSLALTSSPYFAVIVLLVFVGAGVSSVPMYALRDLAERVDKVLVVLVVGSIAWLACLLVMVTVIGAPHLLGAASSPGLRAVATIVGNVVVLAGLTMSSARWGVVREIARRTVALTIEELRALALQGRARRSCGPLFEGIPMVSRSTRAWLGLWSFFVLALSYDAAFTRTGLFVTGPMVGFLWAEALTLRRDPLAWWAGSLGRPVGEAGPDGPDVRHVVPRAGVKYWRRAGLWAAAVTVLVSATCFVPMSLAFGYLWVAFLVLLVVRSPLGPAVRRERYRRPLVPVAALVGLEFALYLGFALPSQLTPWRTLPAVTPTAGSPVARVPGQVLGVVWSTADGAILVRCARGSARLVSPVPVTAEQFSGLTPAAGRFVVRDGQERTALGMLVGGSRRGLPFRASIANTWKAIWHGPTADTSTACGLR